MILLRERNLSEGWRTFSFISGTETLGKKIMLSMCAKSWWSLGFIMSAFLRHSSRLRTVTSSFPISSFTIICVGVSAGRLKVEGAVFGLGVMPVTFEILLVITEISTHICLLRPQGPYICNKTCLFFFFFFFLPAYSSKQNIVTKYWLSPKCCPLSYHFHRLWWFSMIITST